MGCTMAVTWQLVIPVNWDSKFCMKTAFFIVFVQLDIVSLVCYPYTTKNIFSYDETIKFWMHTVRCFTLLLNLIYVLL